MAGQAATCERSIARETRDACRGRRSRVVLTPRRWRQVGGGFCESNRVRQNLNPPATVTTKPITGESTKETVKTIARGMPGVTGVTVVTMLECFFILHARLR